MTTPRLCDGRVAYDDHDDWLVVLANQQQTEIERLQRELNRANRIAGKADRMHDAIDNLRNYATAELRLESIRACRTAAHEYDAAMSDPEAEATDSPAVCRRCQNEIDSGHDRG